MCQPCWPSWGFSTRPVSPMARPSAKIQSLKPSNITPGATCSYRPPLVLEPGSSEYSSASAPKDSAVLSPASHWARMSSASALAASRASLSGHLALVHVLGGGVIGIGHLGLDEDVADVSSGSLIPVAVQQHDGVVAGAGLHHAHIAVGAAVIHQPLAKALIGEAAAHRAGVQGGVGIRLIVPPCRPSDT